MRFSSLVILFSLLVVHSQAIKDHLLPDSSKYNHLTGAEVNIDRGHPVPYRKRGLFKRDYAAALELLKSTMESYQQANVPEVSSPTEETVPPPTEETVTPPTEEAVSLPTEETVPPPTEETPSTTTESATTSSPAIADIEEDDTFDPEEDPDDVDDPPMVNGKPTQREE